MLRCSQFTVLLILAAGFFSTAIAQDGESKDQAEDHREFFVGLRGMPTVTQFWTPEPGLDENTEVIKNIGLGFSAGVYAGEFFSRHWGFETGVAYTRYTDDADFTSSATDSVSGQTFTFEQNVRQEVAYISAPLLARFRTNPEKAFQFSAVAGLQINVLQGLNYYTDDVLQSDTVRNEFDARSDQYANASLSAQFGAGFSYDFYDHWRLDVRGQGGMSVFDIEDVKLKDGTARGATRAISGGLFVGLSYRIPKRSDS